MTTFRPNRKFKKQYDRLFKNDPLIANTFLLICELADEKGQIVIQDEKLTRLFSARFDNPNEYALGGIGDE